MLREVWPDRPPGTGPLTVSVEFGEPVWIGRDVTVQVAGMNAQRPNLSIAGPRTIVIHRRELGRPPEPPASHRPIAPDVAERIREILGHVGPDDQIPARLLTLLKLRAT